jgi:hypothetical protein
MSRPIKIEISDHLFALLERQAAQEGIEPGDLVQRAVEKAYASDTMNSKVDHEAAQARFERHFGTWDCGHPIASDNEQIDADLVTEYGRSNG